MFYFFSGSYLSYILSCCNAFTCFHAVSDSLLFTHTCPVTEFAVASHLNTANSCCHHVFLRHFLFQKCLSVNSYGKMPLAFILSLQSLPCKNLFIILIILLQKLRRIQTIRAHRLAVSAVQAVLYLLHLRLSLRGEVSR